MGKQKGRVKPFIEKKNATTYALVCRDVDDGSDEEVNAGDDRVFARMQARSPLAGCGTTSCKPE